MQLENTPQITMVLDALVAGDDRAADRLMPMVYDELRRVAASYLKNESPSTTLQATAMVHEAFIKLCGQQEANWQGRTHFFAVSAQAMRRILVDHARSKASQRRGGGWTRIELDHEIALSAKREEDVLALDEALGKLDKVDQRLSKIVELRFFGGLTVQEVADVLGLSKSTIESDWTVARAWLRRELNSDEDGATP